MMPCLRIQGFVVGPLHGRRGAVLRVGWVGTITLHATTALIPYCKRRQHFQLEILLMFLAALHAGLRFQVALVGALRAGTPA